MSLIESLRRTNNELKVSDRIKVSHLISPTVAECQNGMIFSTLQLCGCSYETEEPEVINQLSRLWHRVVASMDERCALHVTMHRKRASVDLPAEFSNKYCHQVYNKYYNQFVDNPMYQNIWYITIIFKGMTSGNIAKKINSIKKIQHDVLRKERDRFREVQIRALADCVYNVKCGLSVFNPELLGEDDSKSNTSGLLDFISIFINAGHNNLANISDKELIGSNYNKKQHNKYPRMNLSGFMSRYRIFFGDCIQFQGSCKNDIKYGAMLSIKNYSDSTSIQMMHALLQLPVEYINVNSFAVEAKEVAQNKVKKHSIKMQSLNDPALSQIHQLDQVRDDIQSDRLKLGLHQNSILILADNKSILEEHVRLAVKVFLNIGFVAVRETIGQEPAFWSLMPANFCYMARRSLITSKNFVDFTPLQGEYTGYINSNHLKSSLAIAVSSAMTPIYFNLHAKGSSESLSSGHTFIVGGNGSGKTVAMCFIDSQLSQYNGRSIFFDRNQGCEVYIRACNGEYMILSPEHQNKISFNPFKLASNSKNISFVKLWLRQLMMNNDLPLDDKSIYMLDQCVDYAFHQLDPNYRNLSNVVKYLPIDFAHWDRVHKWIKGVDGSPDGEYAYLFDNEQDIFINSEKIGFDMTYFLDHEPPEILSAVTMYLFYQIELQLDGTLVSIFMDEGWQYLTNAYWQSMLRRWLATLRKLNAHIIFATQSVSTITDSDISRVILDNMATLLVFPNSQAKEFDYIDGLNLTSSEFLAVKNTSPLSRYFLYKQGDISCLCKFPLRELQEELSVFSSSVISQAACSEARSKCGNNSSKWLLEFYNILNS